MATQRQQHFHKRFSFHVVTLTAHHKSVKQEAEADHEVEQSRSTRSQRTITATHVKICLQSKYELNLLFSPSRI